MLSATAAVALALLAVAAASDLWRRIIPNALPAGIAAMFALAAMVEPAALVPLDASLTAVAVFAGGAGLFALGWMGGGDVKLLAATALWAGSSGVFGLLILTGLAGGALGLSVLLWQGGRRWLAARGRRPPPPAPTVPYGVAIAIAGATVLAGRF